MDYFIPDTCRECHGTLASDGKHLFSAPYCSVFLTEDDGLEDYGSSEPKQDDSREKHAT